MEQNLKNQWQERFGAACKMAEEKAPYGIGTLREKMIHSAIKYTIEPNSTYHEVRVEGFVADVVAETTIWEVQTGSFTNLSKKLSVFLNHGKVTVVYPVAHKKWIAWIDEETGEVTSRRKSPKTGKILEIFYELYKIRPLLQNSHLSFQIWLIDMEEYRCLNGWDSSKKRGAARYERRPLQLVDIFVVEKPADWKVTIPKGLPQVFTCREVEEAAEISHTLAYRTIKTWEQLGLVERHGTRGRAHQYCLHGGERELPTEE